MKRGATRVVLFLFLMGLFCGSAFAQQVNDKIEVLWNGKWYKAIVLKIDNSKFLIHYEGYGSNWDEWIGKDRIKQTFTVGSVVKVLWKNQWYKASILKTDKGKYLIHYEGYASTWDEWVGSERIKMF